MINRIDKTTHVSYFVLSDMCVAMFKPGVIMSKGVETKGYILNKAREVFCRKGFISVTMKDICEATGLSRGGLYRHYSSTKDIFIDQLNLHKINTEKILDEAIRSKVPGKLLLESFFSEQLKEINSTDDQITFAVYEFSVHEKETNPIFKERFNEGVKILSKLFNYAIEESDIDIEKPRELAMHIIYTLEGLKMSKTVLDISKDEVQSQINYMRSLTGL